MSFLTRFVLEFFRLSLCLCVYVEPILTVNKESQIKNGERIEVKSKRVHASKAPIHILHSSVALLLNSKTDRIFMQGMMAVNSMDMPCL